MMSKILSTGTTILVSPPFVSGPPPYALPTPGQSLLIGNNNAEAIRPSVYDAAGWSYSLFRSYGGGTLVNDLSAHGAYVITGTGGHQAPGNLDAAVFDFSDATWKLLTNANGVAARSGDYDISETNGAPDVELAISGVTPNAVPAPAHVYLHALSLEAGQGGGARGSVVLLVSSGQTTSGQVGGFRAHRFDLATRTWSRFSTNQLPDVLNSGDAYYSNGIETSCVFDATAKRMYQVAGQIHAVSQLAYVDLTDHTWKAAPAWPAPATLGSNESAFLDDTRRLIVMQTSTGALRAIDLTNIAAGVTTLAMTGTLPDVRNRWHLYPLDGCFYTYPGTGSKIWKLQPPSSNPLGNTWTVTSQTVGGAGMIDDYSITNSGPRHYSRFFYVPAIQCFAWIPGGPNQTVLVKPQ
jgi:hypothetical protein